MDEKYSSVELDLMEGMAKLKTLVSLLKDSFEAQGYPGDVINVLCVIKDQIDLLDPTIQIICEILEGDIEELRMEDLTNEGNR